MSIDKSLRRKNTLLRARNVLKRDERIKVLQDEERWQEGRSPFALPKVPRGKNNDQEAQEGQGRGENRGRSGRGSRRREEVRA